jgi:hypothetical protein
MSTTTKGFRYPPSTDRVADGAVAMQHLAEDVDAYLGDWATYAPAFTNVTGGAGTFRYRVEGKTLFLKGNFSAGTATAAGVIQVALPAGMSALHSAVVPAQNNNVPVAANTITGGTTVRVFADNVPNNFAAGASVAAVHYNGEIELT